MRNIKVLTTAARRLRVPLFATEQYPKGLGHTLQEVVSALGPDVEAIEKVAFSCCAVGAFRSRLDATGARTIVLVGIEAHVTVLMSALDLLAEGYSVHVVADAVTSRSQANWRLAMEQLRQAGAVVTTTETVLFQLLGQADTEDFRELARLIR
jgi:nicotinamidase-related amidase